MFFTKKQKYQMNITDANAALQNILATCQQPPSSLPVDKILLRQKAKVQKYNILLCVTSLFLLLTFLLPLCVIPHFSGMHSSGSHITLVSDSLEDDILTLTFEGKDILFSEAYLQLGDGTIRFPLSYDEASGTICFPYYRNTEIYIYIPVENAPVYQLFLSPR